MDMTMTYLGFARPEPTEGLIVGDEWQVPGGGRYRWDGQEWQSITVEMAVVSLLRSSLDMPVHEGP